MNKVLIIAAHPDDEVLGCGATIAKHINNGDEVQIVFLADGFGSRDNGRSRDNLALQASKILSCNKPIFLNLPDNKLDTVPFLDIVQHIESVINNFRPKIIYTHHIGDLNIDHQIAHKVVMTACRPQPEFYVKEIYAFEVPSSTEWQTPGYLTFSPNVYIDISDQIEDKRKALEIYSEEMPPPPHSRSIDNVIRLNALRGCSVGVDYAEAFILLRKIG
jgi:LmbE family N-acetylglucosaminyl deacetylase